jgi:signal transduction histidine kinase
MRGCGPVPEDAVDGLNGIVNELRSMLHNITHSIREELGLKTDARI